MIRPLTSQAVAEMPAPAIEELRIRALERLYLRLDAVDDLIRSLEVYQQTGRRSRDNVIEFSAVRKCS
jgi:hypothetical protein